MSQLIPRQTPRLLDRSVLNYLFGFSLLVGLAACGSTPATTIVIEPNPVEQGSVEVHGRLGEIMLNDDREGVVGLDEILTGDSTWAIGMLEGLEGQITIVADDVWIARGLPDDQINLRVTNWSTERAALLVTFDSPQWRQLPVESDVRWADFDGWLARTARDNGVSPQTPFLFTIEGNLRELRYHVTDRSRIRGPTHSSRSLRESAVAGEEAEVHATLIGFHSRNHRGAFTFNDSYSLVHMIIEEPRMTGQVDHVVIPAGSVLRLALY